MCALRLCLLMCIEFAMGLGMSTSWGCPMAHRSSSMHCLSRCALPCTAEQEEEQEETCRCVIHYKKGVGCVGFPPNFYYSDFLYQYFGGGAYIYTHTHTYLYNLCVCVCICMYLTQAKAQEEAKQKQAEEAAKQKATAEAKVYSVAHTLIWYSVAYALFVSGGDGFAATSR